MRLTRVQSASVVLSNAALGDEAGEYERPMTMTGEDFGHNRAGRAEALGGLAALLALRMLRRGPAAPAALKHQALRDALTHRFRSLIERKRPQHAAVSSRHRLTQAALRGDTAVRPRASRVRTWH